LFSGGNRNYILGVLLADTSQLKNRGLILAYIASPYLITTFTSGFFAAYSPFFTRCSTCL
jgi:hypothetical protein